MTGSSFFVTNYSSSQRAKTELESHCRTDPTFSSLFRRFKRYYTMTVGICLSLNWRNISANNISNHSANMSTIGFAEWITNSVSLLLFVIALMGNVAALFVMLTPPGPLRLTKSRYLVNLAVADLLRTCFIPFTIIARVKRDFMFGGFICKTLPIVQGLSVSVDVFTLVCIGIERYLAICHPFLTLKLQSMQCASLANYVILTSIWILGLATALPNFYMHNLCFLPKMRKFKCEKMAPDYFDERLYMISLDVFYFIMPMLAMIVLYTLIILKMSRKSRAQRMRSLQGSLISKKNLTYSSAPVVYINSIDQDEEHTGPFSVTDTVQRKFRYIFTSSSPRTHQDAPSSVGSIPRADRHRRKALKILIILILEFFICWTPLYLYHTIGTFDRTFYRTMPSILVDLVLLFSFASASCNPITYYFMSKRYRIVLWSNLISICSKNNHSSTVTQYYRSSPRMIRIELSTLADRTPRGARKPIYL